MVSPGNKTAAKSFGYLVIRDGKKWSDVFRLVPGRTVTIGRSPNNQIVIREDQASRHHAEIFQTAGKWTLRDLTSRNGTFIGQQRVSKDTSLNPGDVIWIAGTQLAFVNDLSSAYDRKVFSRVEIGPGEGTIMGLEADDDEPTMTELEIEPATITHRRQTTKFLEASQAPSSFIGSEEHFDVTEAAAKLCRLAFTLANETTARGIARVALDSLIEETHVDAGAVLMIPVAQPQTVDPYSLEVIAWRSENRPEYQRVSRFLCETVIKEGEAVLARDIQDDSALGLRDSKGEIHATSVICAPIRVNKRTRGLIHLYSTRPEGLLEPHDLEFTLAVAETVALALRTRYREQKLVEDLSKTKYEIDSLRKQLGVENEIIGSSVAMLDVHRQIAKTAPSKVTVLIRGESGVGKELVARAIHYSSNRRGGPFVCLNCAALTESLLESELFGHERGAFTGATDRKLGKFEAADKGTLMLDEIGEMSPSIQAKFLRVLEGHPFERVGGSKAILTDVRVIAATNRDLEKAVRANAFRKDLFFRLHVVQIIVPPLRQRPEDVVELANFFLKKYSSEIGRRINSFTDEALELLVHYRWPGNVRELKNVVERAVVLSHGTEIAADELLLTNLHTASESQMDLSVAARFVPESLSEVERRHITATLNNTDWNKSRAAQILGIERSTLDRKIKRYRIRKTPGA